MKKYLFSLMTIMMVAMTSMCFVACGDDDDDDDQPASTSISASSLYGLWECSYMKVTYEGQTIERQVDPTTADRLEVTADAYKVYEYSDSKKTWVLGEVGTWVLQGNVLTATDEKGKSHSINILNVTAESFTYEPVLEETKHGETYVVTYKRVK